MLEINTKEDADLILNGLSWMLGEGAAEKNEVAPLAKRILAAWPELEDMYGYIVRND